MPRAKFERTDVPVPSPQRSIIAIVVLVVVAISLVVGIKTLWDHVQSTTNLHDRQIAAELENQTAAATPEGYTKSSDAVTIYLVMVAPDQELTSAYLLGYNSTKGTATLVNLPADMTYGGKTLLALYKEGGATSTISPVSATCGVVISHVLVVPSDLRELAASMKGLSAVQLAAKASSLLKTIKTDMSTKELLALVQPYARLTDEKISQVEAPVVAAEDGSQTIDANALGVALGTLVSQAE